MSNVVSPRGPLPRRVYWRRRLLLLAVLVGVVALVAQLLGGGDETTPVAERTGGQGPDRPAAPAASASPEPRDEARSDRRGQDRREQDRRGRERSQSRRSARHAPVSPVADLAGPLAQPKGTCEPAEVVVAPDVQSTDASGPVPLRLGVSTTAQQACTFEFGPDAVALQVTSGDDLIWQSMYCARALPEDSLVLRPGWLSYVTVEWSGRRGGEGCGDGNAFAEPGYYWAEAAAIGGEPVRDQFELETPPPPKPKPKPKPKKAGQKPAPTAKPSPGDAAEQRSAERSGEPSGQPSQRPSARGTRDRGRD